MKTKVAYLRGLADGMDLGRSKDDCSKMLTAIIDCLEAMAETIDGHDADLEMLVEELDEVYDSLDVMESVVFDEDDDDDDITIEDDFNFFTCPKCGTIVELDDDALEAESKPICTKCNSPLFDE